MKKKRIYHSNTRDARAFLTRSQILKAAKELFQTKGFDHVTISMLAATAKVAMPTIYALFKSKRGVLAALIDDVLPAEQFSSLVDSSMHEPCPKKRLSITAKLARQIYEAETEFMDILRGATVVAPEFKELEQQREQRRYERQGDYVKKLMQDGSLAKEWTLQKARDILWVLTGRDVYRMFVIERNWTPDEYEKWLGQVLVESLLKTDQTKPL